MTTTAATEYLTPRDVARMFPGKKGRPTHVNTVVRWMDVGCRGGIRLRFVMVGNMRLVPREAVGEFIAACTATAKANIAASQAPTTAQQDRRRKQVKAALEAVGLGTGGDASAA